jgi:hypothetical protein
MILANVALPAFFPHSIATLVGIFVIAALEAIFIMRILAADYSESYRASLSANLKSTFVGIPLAWLLWVVGLIPVSWGLSAVGLKTHPLVNMTAIQTVFTGGMIPTEWSSIGSALAWNVMLFPFFLGSVWIERKVVGRKFPGSESRKVATAVFLGNVCSYFIFLIIGLYGLISAIGDYPREKERFEALRARQEEFKKRTRRWTQRLPASRLVRSRSRASASRESLGLSAN